MRQESGIFELWKSDGTVEGTSRVKVLHFNYGSEPETVAFNRMLYFAASPEPAEGLELWRSDGTEEGTVRVSDISPGWRGSNPRDFAVTGGNLYFAASRDTGFTNTNSGEELWVTDGTSTGTMMLPEIELGSDGSSPRELTSGGDYLFFTAYTFTFGREPWILYSPSQLRRRPVRGH